MKRTRIFIAAAAATAASASAVACANQSVPYAQAGRTATAATAGPGSPAARESRAATVGLRRTNLGSILVNSSGRTLYEFTRDRTNKDSCAALRGCPEAWPPLKASGRPTAGPGVKASLLSSLSLPGGGKQVTYAGRPLYTYAGDGGPGETSYVGFKSFGGIWYAMNARGQAVK
jgi:predicted lipoprotein with Yx(FWY)xxD motif